MEMDSSISSDARWPAFGVVSFTMEVTRTSGQLIEFTRAILPQVHL